MTPEQCRAARAWIGWSQGDLAKLAGVSLSTVRDFELEKRVPIQATLGAMRAELEKAGFGFQVFVDGKACGITFSPPLDSKEN